MKRLMSVSVVLLLLTAALAYATDRPHEGKITRINMDQKVLTVQGEKGDQWELYFTETTKLQNGLTFGELREGDSVHFDFQEKDGKMWVTELRRTHKADKS